MGGVRRFTALAGRLAAAPRTQLHRLATPFEPMRAPTETMLGWCLAPALLVQRPADPKHVLVVPGLGGGPQWCAPLRAFLTALGHTVHQPLSGTMKGTNAMVMDRLEGQVRRLSGGGRPLVLIGWSAGGAYLRQVAFAAPDRVSAVITLGTPIGGRWYGARPGTADSPMPVPSTAIFSRSDPWVWHERCRQVPAPQSEDIEIVSSHLGMATHPSTLHAIADRLDQPPGTWRPYRPTPLALARTTSESHRPTNP